MSALKYYRLFNPFRRMWIDPFNFERSPSRFFDRIDHFERSLVPPEIQRIFYNPDAFFKQMQAIEDIDDAVDSSIKYEKDKFKANLDVQMFKPEEITVKVSGDNTITIEGKHEEKEDKHGLITRHFIRKYVLPKGHDVNKVETMLSSDGVLTITAPKIEEVEDARSIPITQTGQPLKSVESKKTEDK